MSWLIGMKRLNNGQKAFGQIAKNRLPTLKCPPHKGDLAKNRVWAALIYYRFLPTLRVSGSRRA
jgi:hypothetical protein